MDARGLIQLYQDLDQVSEIDEEPIAKCILVGSSLTNRGSSSKAAKYVFRLKGGSVRSLLVENPLYFHNGPL